jgi:1,4-alpha-glucan branching enzyme
MWMGGGSGILVREEQTVGQERRYRVKFSIRIPEARSVEVAGDFNQWNPVALKPSGQADGTFALEVPMEEGTYTYAFLVDGKKWIPDPAVSRKVADGFGNVNSLINL